MRKYGRQYERMTYIFCRTCGIYGKAYAEFVPVYKRKETRKTWKGFIKHDTLYWNSKFEDCVRKRHKVEVNLTGKELRKRLDWFANKKKVKRIKRPMPV